MDSSTIANNWIVADNSSNICSIQATPQTLQSIWTTSNATDYSVYHNYIISYEKIFDALSEDELEPIIDTILERDKHAGHYFVVSLVKKRHFSEEFLLKYLKELTMEDMMEMHRSDILSKQYSSIVLATEL